MIKRFIVLYLLICLQSLSADKNDEVISVKDIYDHSISLFDRIDTKGHLFFFTTTDCPIANAYAPEMKRISQQFKEKIKSTLVYVDMDMTHEDARSHVTDFSLDQFDFIFVDRKHQLVDMANAEVTPSAALFNNNKELIYMGAINNLFSGLGDKKFKATKHYLKDALEDFINGKKVNSPKRKPYGCYIQRN